jgi:N-acetylmuramoyl-L-alanine amidase
MRRSAKNFFETFRLIAIVLAGMLLAPAPSQAIPQTARKAEARTQFSRAEKDRTALEGQPQKERSVKDYERAIAAYRRVVSVAPNTSEAPAALVAIAELYQQMGRQFDLKYFQKAIDTYQFLLHEYPTSHFRADAMFTLAQIEQEDIDQPDLAEKNFQEFLKKYPHSPKAAEAQEALKEIAADREKSKKASSKKELAEEREEQRKMPRVTNIRQWNADSYTRIVISLEEAVKYQAARIANPDRIYFDLYTAKLSSAMAGKTLDVQNGFLKAIRVAQNQVGVVRVVLEVDKVKDYSVFLLKNPYRLVIDVYGEPVQSAPVTTAKNQPPDVLIGPPSPEKGSKPAKTSEKSGAKAGAKSEKKPPDNVEVARKETPEESPNTTNPPEKAPARSSERTGSQRGTPPVVPKPTRNGQHSLTRALGLKIGKIVIDPGHGGHDTGTIGPTGLKEKDLTLDVALRLGKLIEEKLGAEVVYTREDDTFVPLEDRTALANQVKADMFISIHANSSRDHSARGVETYYLNFAASEEAMEVAARENALAQASLHDLQDMVKKIARNEKIEESRELAADVQSSLTKRLQRNGKAPKNRGVKRAPFVVLIGANMPSVLAEVSFLSNPSDETLLKKGDHRQRIAEGLFSGVSSYLESLGSLSNNLAKVSANSP